MHTVWKKLCHSALHPEQKAIIQAENKVIFFIMRNKIITSLAASALVLLAASCSEKKFKVEGEITNAKDSTLYFENMSLEGPVVLDSVKLGEKGDFAFSDKCIGSPEFYRLRIAGQIINISADSTETISVKAKYPEMSWRYDIEGSENCKKIQQLAYMQIALQNRCIAIMESPELSVEASTDSIEKVIGKYKEKVKAEYIIREPMKAYAYFALFQAIGSRLIFNPRENREDIKMFAAVATSWDTFYPDAERGKNLHNIALEGMRNMRIVDSNNRSITIDAEKISTTSIIDLTLTDNKGIERKLSALKGKVVLLDFHSFETKESTERIMQLRSIYDKYHAQGLEIYQVAVGENQHFWKTSVAALPWISVFDASGVSLSTYNVQTIPTFFLLNRECTPVKRDIQISDIDAEIKALL